MSTMEQRPTGTIGMAPGRQTRRPSEGGRHRTSFPPYPRVRGMDGSPVLDAEQAARTSTVQAPQRPEGASRLQPVALLRDFILALLRAGSRCASCGAPLPQGWRAGTAGYDAMDGDSWCSRCRQHRHPFASIDLYTG